MSNYSDFISILSIDNISKGQLISKCLLGVFKSFKKKRTETFQLDVLTIVVGSNFFVHFLEELKIPKRHFEIKLPLPEKILCFFAREFEKPQMLDKRISSYLLFFNFSSWSFADVWNSRILQFCINC